MFADRLSLIVSATLAAAVLLHSGCKCESPYEGVDEGDQPPELAVKYKESQKGEPKTIGCADGQREGFADTKQHPRIAGCAATWKGTKSLRDAPTGVACGDDGKACAVPADACAEGWHVCGKDGKTKDIKDRVSAKECHGAGPGRFNAGLSHGQTDELCPPKPKSTTEFPCTQGGIGSEPVCCGDGCKYGKCRDGVWTGKTKISKGVSEGCGAVTAKRNGGVLCCSDAAGAPEHGEDEQREAGGGAAPSDAKDAPAGADKPEDQEPDAKDDKGAKGAPKPDAKKG